MNKRWRNAGLYIISVITLIGITHFYVYAKSNVVWIPDPAWVEAFGTLLLPILSVVYFFWYRQYLNEPNSAAMSFGKSKARVQMEPQSKVNFSDIAGLEEAKTEVYEIIDFLKNADKYAVLGARFPKGVLLKGPPGTGKTLLAKAIAGEACVPFFSISGSEFVEMFVGVGASRVRDLFEQAKANAPCIVFIDEIDAVGGERGSGGGAADERAQTLNQLLTEMDGFDSSEGIIMLAATNRADILDPALLRPGRFDRTISVQYPKTDEREMILRVHTGKVSLEPDVSLRRIAELTYGFSGAELSALINEAKISAVKMSKYSLKFSDLESSIDRIRRRRKERIAVETNEDKWRIAIHECGHLSANFIFPNMEKIESISIFSLYQPAWFNINETQLPPVTCYEVAKGSLITLLCGRAAEEFFFHEISSLSESDIAISTALAYKMFSNWGMNKQLGLVNDHLIYELVISRSLRGLISPDKTVNKEIKEILEETYDLALKHVQANARSIVEWASELYEKEFLGYKEINKIREKVKFRSSIHLTSLVDENLDLKSAQIVNDLADSSENFQTKKVQILIRNKEILEMQLATLGINAPPHLITQLEDIKNELEELQ